MVMATMGLATLPGVGAPVVAAWRDLAATARLWRLVWSLGWMDIRLRYRGSWLGPFWLSLSTGVMVTALGGLYPALFHVSAGDYVPYLAVSLILWSALVQLVADAAGTFVQQEAVIHAIRLPLAVHAARVVVRNLLALAHQGVVLIPVFVLFGGPRGVAIWTALPALAVWAVDGFFLVLALGALSARFRDIPPITASAMQLAFLVTPVIWRAEQLGSGADWLGANPLHALMSVLRAPLLGQPVASGLWMTALASSAAIVLTGSMVFARARTRLAFWL